MPIHGTIFNIQRYTIHDGPGIRTELFLKGCPLRCRWCGNPESHKPQIQPGVYSIKCIGEDKCGCCVKTCPEHCLQFRNHKLVSIDRTLCTNCMKCADVCPADAIRHWGQIYTVEQAMETILKDVSFYESSGGGVTLSGGEPLAQSDFVLELLKACKKENIHTCVESTLCMDWSMIETIIPYTDLFITDLKHMDSASHKYYTGVPNEKLLENMKRLASLQIPLIIRIPVIPKVNDSMEHMTAVADFILNQLDNHIFQLQLLEFMRLGEEKYKSLDVPYPMEGLETDKDAFTKKIKDFADYFNHCDIRCNIGTTTKEGRK